MPTMPTMIRPQGQLVESFESTAWDFEYVVRCTKALVVMEEVGLEVGLVVAARWLLHASNGAIVEKTSAGGQGEPTEPRTQGYRPEADHRQPGFDGPSEQAEKATR